MSRKIKFRAFYNGVMIYGVTVATDPLHVWIDDEKIPDSAPEDFYDRLTESDVGYWILDNFELMQYTGLKDKNGKDIYEGDIVKKTHHYSDGSIGYVSFKCEMGGMCGFTSIEKYGEFALSSMQKQIEVIGNIHENPELLNKQPA